MDDKTMKVIVPEHILVEDIKSGSKNETYFKNWLLVQSPYFCPIVRKRKNSYLIR